MTTRASRQPARATYDRVAELVRAGLTNQAAISQVAEAEGRTVSTVSGAYYATKRKLEGPSRGRGKAPQTAPKVTAPAEGNGKPPSALEAVDAAMAALVALKAAIYQLEADATLGRAVKVAMTPDP